MKNPDFFVVMLTGVHDLITTYKENLLLAALGGSMTMIHGLIKKENIWTNIINAFGTALVCVFIKQGILFFSFVINRPIDDDYAYPIAIVIGLLGLRYLGKLAQKVIEKKIGVTVDP